MFYLEDRAGHRIYEGRFTNAGDMLIAIVATVTFHDGKPVDWAAYIGGLPNRCTAALLELRSDYKHVQGVSPRDHTQPTEEEAMLSAAHNGNKIPERDARYYFCDKPFDTIRWRE